jgi:hypothetical protein
MWPLWKAEMVAAKAKCVSRQFHVLDISLQVQWARLKRKRSSLTLPAWLSLTVT